MNLDTLKEIVKVAKDQGVSELKVEGKDYVVTVSFQAAVAPVVHHVAQPMIQPASTHVVAPVAPVGPLASRPATSDAGLHVIKSPFVGTFYSAPSPGKPVYAKQGDKVKAGQTLCVLEAMKIMNEIDADINGEIIEICVENESLVEFGQPLFKIRPN